MKSERRFKGKLSDEYAIIRTVLPHFDALQACVGHLVAGYKKSDPSTPLNVLEIGCGDGLTSSHLLSSRKDLRLTAIDNEKKMIRQATRRLKREIADKRCRLKLTDALAYVKRLPANSVDVVASAMTLHNMQQHYRARLHCQLYRVLKPGGLFINADKYAPDDETERFAALGLAITRFFNTFVPLRKFDLLKNWVLHNVADQSPDRVMREKQTIRLLRSIGFTRFRIVFRHNMEAVLLARKKN